MLLACITGLPLIFSAEIDALKRALGNQVIAEEIDPSLEVSLDAMAKTARLNRPEANLQLLFQDDADPGVTSFAMGKQLDGPIGSSEFLRIENSTGDALGAFRTSDGIMGFLFLVHSELYAGVPGALFLGLVSLLLAASLISGIVLYSPFMRSRAFAVIRLDRGSRTKWFDLHNALGIVLAGWLLVVTVTGIINTLAAPITQFWLINDMQKIVDLDETPLPTNQKRFSSIDDAVAVAQGAVGAGRMLFVAMPGSELTSDRHYVVVFVGETPVTSRLYYGAIVNAYTGELIAAPQLPWYLAITLLSQPLHFGDYGGFPLKVIWLVFGIGSLVLLWSGLVLWWKKRTVEPVIERTRRGQLL